MDTSNQIDFAFLDSGTGGIPYMKEVKKLYPQASCLYLGDTANFPYGQKEADQITECASHAVNFIIKKWNPKVLVIACNTISVTSLPQLRATFRNLPIVGTVPAIRLAARTSHNKNIGLLATNATVNHPYNKKLIKDFAADCKVFSRGDPDLVSFIEHSFFTASLQDRLNAVKGAASYFASNQCDTIILGCTHFTHMANEIQQAAGKGAQVVDSRNGVARQALKMLRATKESGQTGLSKDDQTFFVTGKLSSLQEKEYRQLCTALSIPWGGSFFKE